MEPIKLVDSDQITVWYRPDNGGIIHHQMHKYTHGSQFREALSAGTKAMRERGATKWLSDDRLNGALPKADEDWARGEWFPETKAAGWKYWAIVQPEKVVGQMNMARFAKMYEELGITARMFSDPGEALHWLENAENDD